jgi:hypothetical protein
VYQSSRASYVESGFSQVERLDQAGSARTGGGLVDIALVGDLVGLDRRWLGHQQDSANRHACAAGARHAQPRADGANHEGVLDQRFGVKAGQLRCQGAACDKIGPSQGG